MDPRKVTQMDRQSDMDSDALAQWLTDNGIPLEVVNVFQGK